jgi:hypothetical protein
VGTYEKDLENGEMRKIKMERMCDVIKEIKKNLLLEKS